MKKLVLHLQDGRDETLLGALRMMDHFLEYATSDEDSAILLVTGPAVRQFRNSAPLMEAIMRTAKLPRVRIELCRNALQQQNLDENQLNGIFTVVPAGICELVALEQSGYAYVKA